MITVLHRGGDGPNDYSVIHRSVAVTDYCATICSYKSCFGGACLNHMSYETPMINKMTHSCTYLLCTAA